MKTPDCFGKTDLAIELIRTRAVCRSNKYNLTKLTEDLIMLQESLEDMNTTNILLQRDFYNMAIRVAARAFRLAVEGSGEIVNYTPDKIIVHSVLATITQKPKKE